MEIKLNSQYIDESAIYGSDWSLNGSFLMFYRNAIRWHSATNVDVSASLNTDYVIETGNGYLKVNGNNYNCSPSTSISQKPITLYGIVGSSKLKGRFKTYYWKIFNNNVLVRNFVPCYRKNDNSVGLYDTISKQFYTNPEGTGTFGKGNNVNDFVISSTQILINEDHTLYAIWEKNE